MSPVPHRESGRSDEPSRTITSWLTLRISGGLGLWAAAWLVLVEPAVFSRAAVLFVALVLMPIVLARLTTVRRTRIMRGFPLAFLMLEPFAAIGLAWANGIEAERTAAVLTTPYVALGGTAILWSGLQLALGRIYTAEGWAGVTASVGLMAGVMFIYLERNGQASGVEQAGRLVDLAAHGHVAAMTLPLVAGWLCGWSRSPLPRAGLGCLVVAMLASLAVPAWGGVRGPIAAEVVPLRVAVAGLWLAGMVLTAVPLLRLATALRRGAAAFGLAIGGIAWIGTAIVLVAELLWRALGWPGDVLGVLTHLHGGLSVYVAAAASLGGLALSGTDRREFGRPGERRRAARPARLGS